MAMAIAPITAMRQAMGITKDRSPITKAAIPGNRTMAAVTAMVIMGTTTDRPRFSRRRKCR